MPKLIWTCCCSTFKICNTQPLWFSGFSVYLTQRQFLCEMRLIYASYWLMLWKVFKYEFTLSLNGNFAPEIYLWYDWYFPDAYCIGWCFWTDGWGLDISQEQDFQVWWEALYYKEMVPLYQYLYQAQYLYIFIHQLFTSHYSGCNLHPICKPYGNMPKSKVAFYSCIALYPGD